MEAYIDLSIIVYLFNILLSFIYSMIIFDNLKYKKTFIIFTIIFLIISGIVNLFYISFFLIFSMIIYTLFIALFDYKLVKSLILTLILYYINCSLMLLIGGCFLYNGILLISIPFISLFVFIQPIYICFIHIIFTLLIKYIKNKGFIYNCIITIENKIYKAKGYYDSGNFLMYDELPVIFIKGDYINNNGKLITINTINNDCLTYLAYKGEIKIKRKIKNVYIVFVNEDINFNNCDILLNKNLL